MSRDWDKLRRQDKAKKPELFPLNKPKRFKKHRPFRTTTPKVETKTPPDLERVLRVETTPFSLSRWRRTKGQWRCLEADPQIEWFIRVVNLETVEAWLLKNHLQFKWHRATPVCTAHNKQTEDIPAEAYPPHQASALSRDNTDTSLNNPSPEFSPCPVHGDEPGLERTGLTNPCRLIRLQTQAISC